MLETREVMYRCEITQPNTCDSYSVDTWYRTSKITEKKFFYLATTTNTPKGANNVMFLKRSGRGFKLRFGPTDQIKTSSSSVWNGYKISWLSEVRRQIVPESSSSCTKSSVAEVGEWYMPVFLQCRPHPSGHSCLFLTQWDWLANSNNWVLFCIAYSFGLCWPVLSSGCIVWGNKP